ncbi:ATP12 family chaperone protein [Novosphingobium sp. M1R2S20]|uniref:ATP12 family chaperone protein n=1 Tax=Novosphingobium rhizovicinum TaxID=3228928 RepID=A0ABV3R8E0_9SPHN
MKRFYKSVSVAQDDGGWRVQLDGRGIKTAGGAVQSVPARKLADALAAEWAAQGEQIDPASFPLRDLTDYAIDSIASGREDPVEGLLRYAETDTLCYRADPDEPLHRRQIEVWEPLLTQAEARFDVRFVRASGIVHRPQPEATLETLRTQLQALGPFHLAAMRMLASLSASLTIALLAIEPEADIPSLWHAANLEEEWQAELWGRDEEAEARRQERFDAFALAARFVDLVRSA